MNHKLQTKSGGQFGVQNSETRVQRWRNRNQELGTMNQEPRTKDQGLDQADGGRLVPDADSVGRDDQKLAAVVLGFGMDRDVVRESLKNHRHDLGVVVDFQRNDSKVARGRIGHDVREVAIKREQYCVKLLRAGKDNRVSRLRVHVVAHTQHLVTLRTEVDNDGV